MRSKVNALFPLVVSVIALSVVCTMPKLRSAQAQAQSTDRAANSGKIAPPETTRGVGWTPSDLARAKPLPVPALDPSKIKKRSGSGQEARAVPETNQRELRGLKIEELETQRFRAVQARSR
jgi:hypothetical protein